MIKKLIITIAAIALAATASAQGSSTSATPGWKFTKSAEKHVFLDAQGNTHVNENDPFVYPVPSTTTYYRQYVTYTSAGQAPFTGSSYIGNASKHWKQGMLSGLYKCTISGGAITSTTQQGQWDTPNTSDTYCVSCAAGDTEALEYNDSYYKPLSATELADYIYETYQAWANIYVKHTVNGVDSYTREVASNGSFTPEAGVEYYVENPQRSYEPFDNILTVNNTNAEDHFDRMGYIVTTATASLNLDTENWWESLDLTGVEHLTVNGTLNADDAEHLRGLTGIHHYLMQGCTDPDKRAASIFTGNTTVTGIILPASYATEAIDPAPFAGCTALGAVVAADPTTDDDGNTTTEHLSCYAFKRDGGLWTSTASAAHFPEIWDSNNKISARNIIARGELILSDIHATTGDGQVSASDMVGENIETLDLKGAHYNTTGGEQSMGGYKLFNFNNDTHIKRLLLPEGITELTTDLWGQNGLANLEYVYLPKTVETIGNETFQSCSDLKAVDIAPFSDLTWIGDNAFKNCTSLEQLRLPNKLEHIGSYAFADLQRHFGSLVFPATIDYIGDCAFQNVSIKDVYFVGLKAPSYMGSSAFSDKATFGSGYMNSAEVKVRDRDGKYVMNDDGSYAKPSDMTFHVKAKDNNGNYIQNADGTYQYEDVSGTAYGSANEARVIEAAAELGYEFVSSHDLYTNGNNIEEVVSVLHLNPDLTKEEGLTELKKFTDITRDYSLVDWCIGTSRMWPTEMELKTAHDAANSDKNVDGSAYETEYMPLHQFVLVAYDAKKSTMTEETVIPEFTDGYWWSICLPFSMTKDDISKCFGPDTRVCKLSRVTREKDETTGEWDLQIYFCDEQCRYKQDDGTMWDADDDAVVLEKFRPYMIRPQTGHQDPKVWVWKYFEGAIQQEGNSLSDYVTSEGCEHTGDTHMRKYMFYGNMSGIAPRAGQPGYFDTPHFPKYSYFMYYKNAWPQEWFDTHDVATESYTPSDWDTATKGDYGTAEDHNLAICPWEDLAFSAYSCCLAMDNGTFEDNEDYNEVFGHGTPSAPARMRFSQTFGTDGDTKSVTSGTTGIEHVRIVCGQDLRDTIADYYTLDGRRLTTPPTRKGVYIHGGRKEVVR